MPFVGKCLCEQTVVTLDSAHEDQLLCHCTDCRRTSGSAFTTNVLAPSDHVKITGPVKEFAAKGDSGNMVTRVFCGNCGCAISHKSAVFGGAQAIQTGIFPVFAKIPVGAEIYVKDRWTGLAPVAGAAQFQITPPS